ncbi:SO_0444 family Cu/Zn efflux transporter [Lentisphaerota bacterium ZTH]|nr:SO_0444 family Cu/Zn efflux transporter [Lentisphaerota bacterium]WET05141.1 SO_0444 family Cu/Zn efflux transporter [Lentisphaerota bacterium ZTH]
MTYVINFFLELWKVTCMMAPWLLFGFFAAGVLSVFFSPSYITRHMGKPGLKSIIKAALFGVPLPLCSCGVIPVTVSLKKQGAGRGAAGSFLISTPQTGVDSILATYSLLGLTFAVFRPVIAFINGICGGLLIEHFGRSKAERKADRKQAKQDEKCKLHAGMRNGSVQDRPKGFKAFIHVFRYGYITLLGDIATSLVIGLIIAALISLLVPPDFGAKHLSSNWIAFPVMLLIGIPLYVCSTASVPIAAALMLKGISPGAALVFLICGPATNAATITSMSKVLGKRSVIIYLASVAFFAIAAGLVLNMLDIHLPVSEAAGSHRMGAPGMIEKVSAVVLWALIAIALLRQFLKHMGFNEKEPEHTLLVSIKGMTCSHCSDAVENAVTAVPGVQDVEVDLVSGVAAIKTEYPEDVFPTIKKAVNDAGFTCYLKQTRKKT